MKIKNTFSKGKMNKDFDERLIPEGEYIDALNVRVVNTTSSDAGAVENERGNQQLTFISGNADPVCIGSVSDEVAEKIYWFVVDKAKRSFVYEYNAETETTSLLLEDLRSPSTQVLNFNEYYKITGANVVYNTSTNENLLLWTDGYNPPRCINIERSKTYGTNGFIEEDINLYKKPPKKAPSVIPYSTAQVTENAVKEQFFAFSYRYKYLDGEYSALSSFTDYQFTPSTKFRLDYNTMENLSMLNLFNAYRIGFNTGDKRVTDVQICFKNPDSNLIYVIENLNKKEKGYQNDTEKTYSFSNKKIYRALPDDELGRIFDDIPLTAKAQDFIENRIVYGNITKQYDLLREEGDNQKIKIDYTAEKVSLSQDGYEGTTSISTDQTLFTLDFSGFELNKGYSVFLGLKLDSDEAGSSPNVYFNGEFIGDNAVELTESYSNAQSFSDSNDFEQLLTALTNNFSALVTTTTPPDNVDITYGSFTISATTTNTITLLAPVITHKIDNTPGNTSDVNFSNIIEQFKFATDSAFYVRQTNSNLSLKSNRSYEFGLVYIDKDGRYSSIIPASNTSGYNSSEIFVPIENSVDLNKAKITINHLPPYWADRYKFFIKSNRDKYYNVYSTIFYEDGVYRWVLMTGNNIHKVEAGTNLIVKSDDNGPLGKEVKVKVLAYETKNALDIDQSTENASNEGWIENNKDAAENPIKELSGIYMKIKPVGFSMDFNPNNFATYERSNKIKWGLGRNGYVNATIPKEEEFGISQVKESANYVNLDINTGSTISMRFESYERPDSDGNDSKFYEREFVVGANYQGDANQSAFEKFLIAETSWEKPQGESYYDDPDNQFQLTFIKTGTGTATRHRLNIRSTEFTRALERGYIDVELKLLLVNGLLVFETDPKDLDSDIYYETEQTFDIVGGYHQGNKQNQTNSQSSVVDLTVGNCFSFGNGVESIQIRDERLSPIYNIDLRPNLSLLDGFKKIYDTTTLIYSGAYSENSTYNSLNEFNNRRGITKKMDAKYGSIQKLFARETDLIVFQEDRVSKVLYGKSLVHSSDGTASLTTVEKVLGQDVAYSGEYGISINPESFGNYGGNMYFTDAARGTVLRLGQDGLTPISYYGMKSYFKDTLYGFKNKFNVGGIDPRNHQYVLSMDQSDMIVNTVQNDCASTINQTVKQNETYTYNLVLGQYPGTAVLEFTALSSITVSVAYGGSTYTGTGTSGTVNITVSNANLDLGNVAVVSIDSSVSQNVSITHTCPIPQTRKVYLVVVNDQDEANQSITNRFKLLGNPYYEDEDVFNESGLTKFTFFEDVVGTTYVPETGRLMELSSFKQIGYHTGDFNDCNTLGYLVSAATNLTASQVVAQATYPAVTTTETSTEEENKISFQFNQTSADDNLYLVWNYKDSLPVLVDDSITGITNGGTVTVNVIANDTVPSPYTLTIVDPPSNGTAVVVSGTPSTSIQYTHTAGQGLNDSITYQVSRGGDCVATATLATEALSINENTYIYIYFDSSGSMDNSENALQQMKTNSLKSVLQDLYATGETAGNGNTDASTNGSSAYDSHVILRDQTYNWTDERTLAALTDPDVKDYISSGSQNDFPSDAENVIFMIFQDEANVAYHGGSWSNTTTRTSTFNTDVANLRSRVATLNATNSTFYRGIVFQVDGNADFKTLMESVEGGTGAYTGTNGLSDLSTSGGTFTFEYDIEDTIGSSTPDDSQAPYKPAPLTGRFDKWEYYYLYHVTKALDNLGFDPNNSLDWPRIIDD
jgi:hypothetical protein